MNKLVGKLNPVHHLKGVLNNGIITTGLDTSDATATSEDLKLGKIAYVDGHKIVGSNTHNSDTSQDTVSSSSLLLGHTAHDSEGNLIVGEAIEAKPIYWSKYGSMYYETMEISEESIVELSVNQYRACDQLKKIIINAPNCIKLASYCLGDNPNLEEVEILTRGIMIDTNVFLGNKKLKRVVLPAEVISIQSNSFRICTGLEELVVGEGFSASINISFSDNLTKESLENLIKNLGDMTGSDTRYLVLGDSNLAKLDQEYLDLAASKNWELS